MNQMLYMKIPRGVTEFVEGGTEFIFTLFFLWLTCDYFTSRGRFTIQQIIDLAGAERTIARVARIKKSLQVLINSKILELPGIEDVAIAKPRQVLDANFNHKFFHNVGDEYVIVRHKFIEKLLSAEFKLSEGTLFDAANVMFLALAKMDGGKNETNFRYYAMATDLKTSREVVEECVNSFVKAKIFEVSPVCKRYNPDSVTLIPSRKLDEAFDAL